LAAALSDGLPTPIEPEGLTTRLFSELHADTDMRSAVAEARRQGVRTSLISNTWGVTPPEHVEGMFDAVVLSGREGLRKPEAAIYLLAADRLGAPPDRCVFVDDMPANVEGARAVGMTGVLHRDAAITIPKLEALFGVPLRPASQ
jgi:epoxide hydrolase-like predicted phosphatase